MQQPKAFSIALLAALVLLGLAVWGYGSGGRSTTASVQGVTNSGANSALTAPEILHDFGTIRMKDGLVEKEFTLTNPTSADITITSIVTSCMCTTAYLLSPGGSQKGPFGMPGHSGPATGVEENVRAGESRTLRVVYDPNAHGPAGVGPVDRFVLVTDRSGATLQFEIKAIVRP